MRVKLTYDELLQRVKELEGEKEARVRMEQAMRESEATLESILMTAPIGIGMVHNRVLIWVSSQMSLMLGYSIDELIGKSARMLYENDDEFKRVGVEKYRQIESQGTGEVETRWQRKDGSLIDILLRSSIIDKVGPTSGVIFTALEITDRNRAVEALQRSSENIKLFAHSVVHDLKSPAIAITGLTRRLQKLYGDILPEKGQTYCHQLVKSSEQLAGLVERINTFISTKESPLNLEKIDLKELLQAVREEFNESLLRHDIQWIEPSTLPVIKADRLALHRILRNLVDNALKYGGPSLSFIEIQAIKKEWEYIIAVKNNGASLSTEDCRKIFEIYQRQSSQDVEGSGLGLAIVKELAEQQGGSVWAEPDPIQGVTFFVSIAKQ